MPFIPLLSTLVLLLAMGSSAFAQDEYCALMVKVENPEGGRDSSDVSVSLRDQRGNVFLEGSTDSNGEASFCDVDPAVLFDVVIGGDFCGQVTIRYLEVAWPLQRTIRAFYRNCHSNLPLAGCTLYLRTVSESGLPVGDVSVLMMDRRWETTDRLGRVIQFLDFDTKWHAVIKKEGFESEIIRGDCIRQKPIIQRTVILRSSSN